MRDGSKLKSLSSMLSIRVSLGITVIALAGLLLTTVTLEASAHRRARELVDGVATQTVAQVVRAFDHPIGVIFGLRAAIIAAREQGLLDRGYHEQILRETLVENPELRGTWTAWEPNAFDGKDAHFVNAPAHDATGRFIPYWHRGVDGRGIALRALRDFDNPAMNDFYVRPLRTRRPVLIEPTSDSLAHEVLMTSIALPILKNGRAVGVVSGDLELNDLERYINRIEVPLGGRIAILSTGRLYVYNADKRLLGKPAPPASHGITILDDPRLGDVMRIETPIDFPGVDAHWTVQLDVPLANAMAETRRLELAILLCALAAIVVLAWYVHRAAQRIVGGPLEAIRTDMVALAGGDLSQHPQPPASSREIVQMQSALQVFRDNAIAKTRAEDEQARAIAALGQSLEQIARGDLTTSLGGRFDGAFHKLQSDFNTAMHRVSAAFGAVSVSSRAVNAGADNIHASSRDLADRTERQATGLTQMSQAMEDITGQAEQATNSAHQANRVIDQFREEIQAGGIVIRQAIASMNAMKRSSSEIAEIIGVIEGIAFQTNLLALNAGVEAARAGDAGKGFAVVAAEVRALAARSSQAASDVKTRISTSLGHVQTGVGFVDTMDQTLDRIIARIGEISDLATAIATASERQLASVTAVNTSVRTMSGLMRQNAAFVDGSAAAAHNLSQLVRELNEQVGQFRLVHQTPALLDAA
jgi:methyl-accepting chemotaxis protein